MHVRCHLSNDTKTTLKSFCFGRENAKKIPNIHDDNIYDHYKVIMLPNI